MEKPTEAERERAATLDRNRLATAAREALLLVDDTIAALQALVDDFDGEVGDDNPAHEALRAGAERRDAIEARMLAPAATICTPPAPQWPEQSPSLTKRKLCGK